MPQVIVLLANGFEEIEAMTVIDVLRRAALDVVTAGVGTRDPLGAHGVLVRADVAVEDVLDAPADLVVLPGGMPGATHLRDSAVVQDLLARTCRRKARLAAICAAPIALGRAGLLAGRKATSYPGFASQLPCAEYLEDRVVVDGPITTSRGPGTAMDFALELVTQLKGPDVAARLRADMLLV